MPANTRRDALKALVSAKGINFMTTPILIPPAPYFDLAGEEFGARLILTTGADGADFCLRPDFTLPIAIEHLSSGAGTPAAYGYLGPIFRHRSDGPAEFDQAGLELLASPDADAALDTVIGFARATLDIYGVEHPAIRVGSIDLFEALLANADMPDVWRARIRARFGHRQALERLLDRLAAPKSPEPQPQGMPVSDIAEWVSELMLTSGLSLTESRGPEEIAERYLEKQALEAAHVPAATIALLRDYLAISGDTDTALAHVKALGHVHNIAFGDALVRARRQAEQLRQGGKPSALVFDAGFSPRLDYYTGITFEMTGTGGQVLVSGGQYDRLLRRLGSDSDVPSVGCAVWVERLEAEAGQ